MPIQIIPITDLASAGVVRDTPPVSLPPNVFTDVRNVRFRDGAVRKMEGEVVLENVDTDSAHNLGDIDYLTWWPSPNRTPEGGYYVYAIRERNSLNVNTGTRVYAQDHEGNRHDITPAGGLALSDNWNSTLFAGGFALIINNGVDKPHYVIDPTDNLVVTGIPALAELPGWDSYEVNQVVLDSTFAEGNSRVFDLGQRVDFTANRILVEELTATGTLDTDYTAVAGSPAGTGTVNGTNFVPGILPAAPRDVTGHNFEIYTDTDTNSTVINLGDGVAINDRIRVLIRSRNPVVVRAGVVRSFNDNLVAGDLTEIDPADNNKIIRRLAGVVRTSDIAAPGAVPNNWNPFAAGVNTADEFVLSETSPVQEALQLQGRLYIYTHDSIHVMEPTGDPTVPFRVSPVTDQYGALATESVIEVDGRHIVIGSSDIYFFAGDPRLASWGSIQSVADARIRKYFYDNLNPLHEDNLFTMLNHTQDEIWICYPTIESLSGECDEALIWNYRDNTWTIRDLQEVRSGTIAPIRGGGIPSITVDFTGSQTFVSGDNGVLNTGQQEIQRLPITGNIRTNHTGIHQQMVYDVPADATYAAEGREVISMIIDGDPGPNTSASVVTMSIVNFSFSFSASTLNGGALLSITDNTGTYGIPASSLSGISGTVNQTEFLTAVANFINSDSIPGFTWSAATSGTNGLVLTSDLVGSRTVTTGSLSTYTGTSVTITGSDTDGEDDSNGIRLVDTEATAGSLSYASSGTNSDQATGVTGVTWDVAAAGEVFTGDLGSTLGHAYDGNGVSASDPALTYTVTAADSIITLSAGRGNDDSSVSMQGTIDGVFYNISNGGTGTSVVNGFRGPAYQSGDGGGYYNTRPTLEVGDVVTITMTSGTESPQGARITSRRRAGVDTYSYSADNSNSYAVTINGVTIAASSTDTAFATGQTSSTSTFTIGFPRRTWTLFNNRTETGFPLQRDLTSVMLTTNGVTYNLGNVAGAGGSASRTVEGNITTGTYSASIAGTTLQSFNSNTSGGSLSTGTVRVTRVAGTPVTDNKVSYDIFGSAFNTQNTGRLPNVTAFTRASNGVATFASAHGLSAGDVFRMSYQRDDEYDANWNTTLFTVSSVSGNNVTVTNNTSGFSTFGANHGRYVGTMSSDEDGSHDRILYGTFGGGGQATHRNNANAEYGTLGGVRTVNDQMASGGGGGGSTILSSVIPGSDWHVLTLRPGRWYTFRMVASDAQENAGVIGGASRFRVDGLPSTFSTTSAEVRSTGDNNIASAWIRGYVTSNTLISLGGNSENNLISVGGGGGIKTPFFGGGGKSFTSGNVVENTFDFRARVTSGAGPANITQANGVDITDIALTETNQVIVNDTTNSDINVRGNYTVVNATETDTDAPTFTVTTAGVGLYGVSQAASPSVSIVIRHMDSDGNGFTFEHEIDTDTTVLSQRDNIYDAMMALDSDWFRGVNPDVDPPPTQPARAFYYVTKEGTSNTVDTSYPTDTYRLRLERVTTGDLDGDGFQVSFITRNNGVAYAETQFGGDMNEDLNVAQGSSGPTPSILEFTHPTLGMFTEILGGTQDTDQLALSMATAINEHPNFSATVDALMPRRVVVTRSEVVEGDSDVLTVRVSRNQSNLLTPADWNRPFVQTVRAEGANADNPFVTLRLPDNQYTHEKDQLAKSQQIDLTGDPDSILSPAQIASVIARNFDTDAGWLADTDTDVVVFTSKLRSNYNRTDNGMGTGTVNNVLWSATFNDIGGDFLAPTNPVRDTEAYEHQAGIPVRYAQPTIFNILWSDNTSSGFVFGGAETGVQPERRFYDTDIYSGSGNRGTRTMLQISDDFAEGIESVGQRRVQVDKINYRFTVLPTQYTVNALYPRSITLLTPGTRSPDPSALAPAIPAASNLTLEPVFTQTNEFDILRPWLTDQVKASVTFPVMAQSGLLGAHANRLVAGDLGYLFSDNPYISYVERKQLGFTPEFDVESVHGVALWADGGNFTSLGSAFSQATLNVKLQTTENPGEDTELATIEGTPFQIGKDYKADLRNNGRFMNMRIDDADASQTGGNTAWNVSGLQIEIMKGGKR